MYSKLNTLLAYATTHVPYYKSRHAGTSDVADFPCIEKKMILDDYQAFQSDEYQYYPLSEKVSINRTSGSTGIYLKVPWDNDDWARSLHELWLLRRQYYGIYPTDPYCYFYTTDYRNGRIVTENSAGKSEKYGLGFSKNILTLETARDIYLQIKKFSPKWIRTQPSTAILLAKCMERFALPKLNSLCYIELVGELLLDSIKSQIQEAFGCVVGNMYGCNEIGAVAFECPHGNMHILASNAYVETISAESETDAELLLTGLNNHAMPLIRYAIGDSGLVKKNTCNCNNPNPLLVITKGRCNDVIVTERDGTIDAYIFVRPVEVINERFGNIVQQFHVTQTGYYSFDIKLSIKKGYDGWKREITNLFRENLIHPYLQQSSCAFVFRDTLFPSKSGKLRFFASDMN